MCGRHQPRNGTDSAPMPEPLDVACDYCGAQPMEPCNYDCLGTEENA